MNTLAAAGTIAAHIVTAFRANPRETPFRHWVLDDVLPPGMAARLARLSIPGQAVGEGGGRRETHNAQRAFLTPAVQAADLDCHNLAQALQSPDLSGVLAARTGAQLNGSYLRIEYCRDVDGFWLERHTDIGAKRFTCLIYLNTPPSGEDWGTDIYDADGALAATAPSQINAGVAFVPGTNTWHGFHRRHITGIRRTLIVNYVGPEWRAVNELAFPTSPV